MSESKQAFVEKTFTRTNATIFVPSSKKKKKKKTFSRQIFEIDFALEQVAAISREKSSSSPSSLVVNLLATKQPLAWPPGGSPLARSAGPLG